MALPSFYYDKKFLEQIDSLRIKEQYIKITVLSWQEEPIEEVQGICISGNLNISADSAMRRTGTISIIAEEKDNNLTNMDNLFAINKKCKLELGIKNTISSYEKYGNIIWFPLGIFVMFNPSISHNINDCTISMNLKDKMCLLNGDVGGIFPAPVNLSQVDQYVDQQTNISIEKRDILIYEIILQVMNHYGNENLSKIIISDVPLIVKTPVKWTAEEEDEDGNKTSIPVYMHLTGNTEYEISYTQQTGWTEYNTGDIIGYKNIDFFWPNETKGTLSCNAGDTITSVLDKIINILGNFEYFYDIQGNFIFRQKRNFLNTTYVSYWQQNVGTSPTDMPQEEYNSNLKAISQSTYDFKYNELIINFNNSLSYNNIKNDFVVWGSKDITKTDGSKEQLVCRYHLAIDKKPQLQTHNITLFTRGEGDAEVWVAKAGGDTVRQSTDWREEIYYQILEAQVRGTDYNTQSYNYSAYAAELKQYFPKIFDLSNKNSNSNPTEAKGWKTQILNNYQELEYFLDFIDSGGEIGKYSIFNIGRRTKALNGNNEKINSVFEPNIPDVVFVNSSDYNAQDYFNYIKELNSQGQPWINVSANFFNNIEMGSVPNSCYERIKDLLYEHTMMNDTISFSALPIYYLEPNTLITLHDAPSGIEGDYLIKSISLPLDISGTMSINAYKVFDKL